MGPISFTVHVPDDCGGDEPDELLETFRDGCPGVAGFPLEVESMVAGDDGLAITMRADPRDYVRQCVAFGEPPLDVLAQLQAGGMSRPRLAELAAWLQGTPGLTQTILDTTAGGLRTDQYPIPPGL